MYSIDNGYYLYFRINQEKLTVRMNVEFHKIFIYGYDKREKSIYVSDHYDYGRYTTVKIGFDEFLDAYEMTYDCYFPTSNKDVIFEEHPMIVAKPKKFHYQFNMDWFVIQLHDYLNSTYTLNCVSEIVENKDEKIFWGIKSYDFLIEYLERLEREEIGVRVDYRLFTLLADHKKLLKMRVKFLAEKNKITIRDEEEKYNSLYKLSEVLINSFIKYQMTRKKEIIKKMQKMLADMKRCEEKLLYELEKKVMT